MLARIILGIVAVAVIGGAVVIATKSMNPAPAPVACSMEAKLCPDGSYVARSGPLCEFAACPPVVSTSTPAVIDSGVDITAKIGPTCPVERIPPDPQCADRPYQTTLVLASTRIGANGGVLVHTDAQGHFAESLGPGTYSVRAQSDAMLPRLSPVTFEVVAHKITYLTLEFDSGIR